MADPSIKLHLPERAATLRLHAGVSTRLQLGELRDLRAQIDAAIAAIDHRQDDAPSQAAIERSLARVLYLIDERRETAPAWRARVYATLLAHGRSACPWAEMASASEVSRG